MGNTLDNFLDALLGQDGSNGSVTEKPWRLGLHTT